MHSLVLIPAHLPRKFRAFAMPGRRAGSCGIAARAGRYVAISNPIEAPMKPLFAVLVPLSFALASGAVGAAGDPAAGRTLYQARCAACHSLDHNGVGPAHRGVFGRLPAQASGYAYSNALKGLRQVWNEETLDRWLADPESVAPGQRMGVNVPDAQERSDLIAWLKQAASKQPME
jgi:cytochrome c